MATKPAWGGMHPMVAIGGQEDWILTGGVTRTRKQHAQAVKSLRFQTQVAKEIKIFRRTPIRGGGRVRIVLAIIELFVAIRTMQNIMPAPAPMREKELDETIKEIEEYLRIEAARRQKANRARRISPVYPVPDPRVHPYPYPERGIPVIPPIPTDRDQDDYGRGWFDRLMRWSPRVRGMVRYAELQRRK